MGKAGKGAKARRKLLAAQAAKRVAEAIKQANDAENPLSSLDAFLTVDIPSVKSASASTKMSVALSPSSAADLPVENLSLADAKSDDAEAEVSGAEISAVQSSANTANISFYRAPLPPDLQGACLDLFSNNMEKMYRESSWGFNLDEKDSEIKHDSARFLIVTAGNDTGDYSTEETSIKTKSDDILAFCHFRFEANDEEKPTEAVVYVYELQVSERAQRSGLGKRLMNIMEMVALKNDMKKVMLTVFKSNAGAMSFYLDRMKYVIDETSPSNFEGEEADYEILSKTIGAGGRTD